MHCRPRRKRIRITQLVTIAATENIDRAMPKRSLRLRTAQARKVNIAKQNKFTWRLKKIQDRFSDGDANIKLWPRFTAKFSKRSFHIQDGEMKIWPLPHSSRLCKSTRRS